MQTAAPEIPLLGACRSALDLTTGPLVLAVSGGCDSMVLLRAMSILAPERVAAIATFDHGTGDAARSAVRLVQAEGRRLRVRVVAGRGQLAGANEAAWRAARWDFLRGVAQECGARVATAHSRDDQVETVLMRLLRGAGARGLAGLYAPSDVVRPLLAVDRGTIRAYAVQQRVRFMDDPSNESRRHLRNRVRLDLLPALRRADAGIDEVLLACSAEAARIRFALDGAMKRISEVTEWGGVAVAASVLQGYSRDMLALAWPALAARAGLALDRRGTERLVAFTSRSGVPGRRVQLSGGWEVHAMPQRFELRRMVVDEAEDRGLDLRGTVQFGAWRFRPGARGEGRADARGWTAMLPLGTRLVVRRWQPGDRMVAAGAQQGRRVKRFLSDAGIVGPLRSRWPVVESDGVVVWIPGVRRSDAATARPGRSEVLYECEFNGRS